MSEGTPVARNAACPCGSGRKYKRCCGRDAPSQWSGSSPWHRMRRAEGRLVPEIWAWAAERYGRGLLDALWWDFLVAESEEGEPYDGPPSEHEEFESQFLSWAVFAWDGEPDDDARDWPCDLLGRAYLAEHGDRLDAFERRFVEAACASTASFHQVQGVEPGRSLHLRDLMTGEERRVWEQTMSQSVARGAIFFARVVEVDGTAILCGNGLYMLPPDRALPLLGLREQLAEGPGPIPSEGLCAFEPELRMAYFDLVHALLHPAPPVLHNSDGELFEQIELRYVLAGSPRATFDALRDLAAGARKRDLLAEAERDDRDEIRAVELPWLRRGHRLNAAMENTVLGRMEIRDGRLTVEVNSRPRAVRIRRLVERRLGDGATFEGERIQTFEELREAAKAAAESEEGREEERRRRAEREQLENAPEVRALTERMRVEHWQRWLDEEIPALGGRTPRDAARDPRGRERLEALLLEFEWQDSRASRNAMAPDVDALRRELGLNRAST